MDRVRQIQSYHMDKLHFGDIGYNFLVGGDGNIYIGLGWNKVGAHSYGYNRGSICIAFIGNYNDYPPTPKQINSTQLLLADGVRRNYLINDYHVYGQCQLKDFDSPGTKLYEIIKTWKHWSSEIVPIKKN